MNNDDLRALAKEYNDMKKTGSRMWTDLETMTARMNDIKLMIDTERPGCYDEISLLFGCDIVLDLLPEGQE